MLMDKIFTPAENSSAISCPFFCQNGGGIIAAYTSSNNNGINFSRMHGYRDIFE
jgi:hypothetical protein